MLCTRVEDVPITRTRKAAERQSDHKHLGKSIMLVADSVITAPEKLELI